ncbi:contractile injection system protein, VgrG/Pvc8 family [Kosakonia sp.]|uniref:contractile injection system protein, VgrG/Pvc8 family n=1 Tax=Kosakonia sp. TaxID=1916651 RepID=UPI00289B5DF3|nr:contractile injection system protein, VgrG/Pvc8 family [Kosakonia sp.]
MIDALDKDLTRADAPAFKLELKQKPASGTPATNSNQSNNATKDITARLAPRLIGLTVTDNRGFEADTLTLTLDDSDGKIEMPARDAQVNVSIGRQGEVLTDMGSFIIDQVTHRGTPDQVVITGRSVDFRNDMNTPKERSWHDTTLGEIVKDIAWRNSLSASVAPELATIKIAHIDQSKESDIAFLTRLAIRNGAEIAIKSGVLIFLVPGKCVRAGKAISTVTLSRSDGDSHTFDLADRTAYGSVIARWQDTKTPQKQVKQVKLTRKSAGKQQAQTDYLAGSRENVNILPNTFASKEEALRAAEAAWQERQRNAALFTLTLAQGRADIAPETPVRLTGFKDVINHTPWVIKKLTHGIDGKGFITKLELEADIRNLAYELQESIV